MSIAPAPWDIVFGCDGAAICTPTSGTIAIIPIDLIAWRDNAHLIAAAPDLLAALEAVMCFWAETSGGDDDEMPASIFDNAHAAIAKALGGEQ